MKKICAILMIMAVVPSFATTMCTLSDTRAVVLDPSVAPSTYSNNAADMTWNATFPYGKVYGMAACVSTGGTQYQPTTTVEIAGGETSGRYCWCKLIHPVASRWVFNNHTGSASNCAGNCASSCGNYVRHYSSMRVGLFGSVSQ